MKNTSKPWRVSEDKIAEFTEEIKERPMGVLFEDWDSGPDEELIEKGRAEERKNTEAEKKRADEAEDRADKAEARVKELEALLAADSQG